MLSRAKTCLVCNTPLSFHQAQIGKLCGNLRCRWTYASIPRHQTCAACGRPLAPRELAVKVCADPECRRSFCEELSRDRREQERRQAEAQREQARKLRKRLREQARKLRDRGAAAVGIREPAAYPLVLLPSFAAPVTNLPERRRRALRDHVTRLISQATVGRGAPAQGGHGPGVTPEPSPAPAPAAQAVLGRAFAHCQGSCCSAGDDHAYLTAATIRRYLDAHPGLRPRDVLAAYLACVGNKTYKGSCIYHRPGGCTLPGEMRSDTCNRHFCEGLKAFQHDLPDGAPVRGFFASTRDGAIHGAAFIDEVEMRVVPVPAIRDESQCGVAISSVELVVTSTLC